MTISNAVNRIKWRIEKGGWKPNETDITAFNRVVDFILEKKETQLQTNSLFIKAFVMLWINNLDKYKTNLSDETVLKELFKHIDKPIEYHINQLCRKANDLEQIKLFRSLDISLEHTSPTNLKDINKLLIAIKEKDDDFKRFFGSFWDYKEIKNGLFNNAFHFLNSTDTKNPGSTKKINE